MRNLYYLLKMVRLSLPYKARKYITVLLFIMLGFFLFRSAFAADPNDYRKPNQWQRERIINDAVNKSTVQVDAAKTYPVSTLGADGKPINQTRTAKSTITLGAASGNVAKTLFKRVPAIAIQSAIISILGKSVDWLMDEENNSVKYMGTVYPSYITNHLAATIAPSPSASCDIAISIYGEAPASYKYKGLTSVGTKHNCAVNGTGVNNVGFSVVPYESKEDWVHIPINQVADKIIQQADSGEAPAMQVMTDTALDMLEAGLLDPSLDAASDIPQPDPEEIPDPDTNPNPNPDPEPNPDPNPEPDCPAGYTKEPSGTCVKTEQTGIEFPAFCDWATKVCDFIDWVKTEPTEPSDGAGDIPVENPDPDMHVGILERLYIDMPAECPPDPVLEFMGAKIPFPMSVFCQFASMMKPLILLFAYIKGLSIIGNGLT